MGKDGESDLGEGEKNINVLVPSVKKPALRNERLSYALPVLESFAVGAYGHGVVPLFGRRRDS